MQRPHSWSTIVIAVALAGAAPMALAQTNPDAQSQHPQSGAVTHTPPFHSTPQPSQDQNQNPASMPPRLPQAQTERGQHDMSGTVLSVNGNGMVEVKTAQGTLRVHFPDAARNLQKGEKITLHLAYTVDTPSPPSSM